MGNKQSRIMNSNTSEYQEVQNLNRSVERKKGYKITIHYENCNYMNCKCECLFIDQQFIVKLNALLNNSIV